MIPIVLCLFALTAVVCWGAVAIRRHNARLAARQRPITSMRFRHLNVVNRCDGSVACMAKSHEPTCIRGRS